MTQFDVKRLLGQARNRGVSLREISVSSGIPYDTLRAISCGKVTKPRKNTVQSLLSYLVQKLDEKSVSGSSSGSRVDQNIALKDVYEDTYSHGSTSCATANDEKPNLIYSGVTGVCESCGFHTCQLTIQEISSSLALNLCDKCLSLEGQVSLLRPSQIISNLKRDNISIRHIAKTIGLRTESSLHRVAKDDKAQLSNEFDSNLRLEYLRWLSNPEISDLHKHRSKSTKAFEYDEVVVTKIRKDIDEYLRENCIDKNDPLYKIVTNQIPNRELIIETNKVFKFYNSIFEHIKINLIIKWQNEIEFACALINKESPELEQASILKGFAVGARVSAVWIAGKKQLKAFEREGAFFKNYCLAERPNRQITTAVKQIKEITKLIFKYVDEYSKEHGKRYNAFTKKHVKFDGEAWKRNFEKWFSEGPLLPCEKLKELGYTRLYFTYTHPDKIELIPYSPSKLSSKPDMAKLLQIHLEEELKKIKQDGPELFFLRNGF